MKEKQKSENADLKLNIQKTKIRASGPITSWHIDGGGGMETVTDFVFLGSKITADGGCSHLHGCSVKESVIKSRDILLPTKVHIGKATGEGLGAGGEGDNRGRDGWMASPTRWTCV